MFLVPARIVEIDDAKALELQLVENSQRVKVQQELMRQASIQTSMNVYGQAMS